MRFAVSLQQTKDPALGLEAAVQETFSCLEGLPIHAVFLFVSSLYKTDWRPLLGFIRREWGDPLVLGCTGGGVLGKDRELESTPALSLAAAHLPRVELHPFTISTEESAQPQAPGFWIEKLGATPSEDPIGILLPEPFSCDVMTLVSSLQAAYPKLPLIGGLASGAQEAGENALFLNEEVVKEGAVGLLLTGDVTLQTIVAQGCRPIGRAFIITKAEENVILELAGLPATEALRQILDTLPEKDRRLAQRALFLGIVMDERKEKFGCGDFLIRNLIGMDRSMGALAIGDRVRVGQTVQFQVRDADSSKEDLQLLLKESISTSSPMPSTGGLLFSCLGRGQDLYGEPHYDLRTIQAALGNIPIAGFFCNGEIGPVGGHNFVHGFTSSLGLFRPRSALKGDSPSRTVPSS